MKAVVAAFNQEEALVGAFSVIVKTDFETDGSFHSTTYKIQKPSAMVDTIPHIYHSSRKQNSISIHHNISNTNKNTAALCSAAVQGSTW